MLSRLKKPLSRSNILLVAAGLGLNMLRVIKVVFSSSRNGVLTCSWRHLKAWGRTEDHAVMKSTFDRTKGRCVKIGGNVQSSEQLYGYPSKKQIPYSGLEAWQYQRAGRLKIAPWKGQTYARIRLLIIMERWKHSIPNLCNYRNAITSTTSG